MNFSAAFFKRPGSHKLRYVIPYNRKSIAFRAAYLLSVIMAPELAILLVFWLRFFFGTRRSLGIVAPPGFACK